MSSYDPFSNQNGPFGQKRTVPPKGGGPQRPNLPQGGFLFGVAAGLALLVGVYSAFYTVDVGHQGVVLRFGQHVDTTNPGLHFKMPFGIDRVISVPVEFQQTLEFGFRTLNAGIQSNFSRGEEQIREAVMPTGDLNVANVEWVSLYKISDPIKYLFSFRDVRETLHKAAEATMRTVIGDHSFEEILTGGREAIEVDAKRLLVEINEKYDTGIAIQQLKLRDVNAPPKVRPALSEVEEAKQEAERMKKEALREYNEVIPRARGKAEEMLRAAEGYAIERTNRAKGDAERFIALQKEYAAAPRVTRERLYLEAMDEIMSKTENKVFVDSKASGLLPLLNLNGQGVK